MLEFPWTRQPQGPVRVNRKIGLSRRVGWLALGSQWGADIAGGVGTAMQANGSIKTTHLGRAFAFPGTGVSGYYNYTLTWPTGNIGTFAMYASRIGQYDTNGMVLFGTNTTNSVYFQLPNNFQNAFCFGQTISSVDPAVYFTNKTDVCIVFTSDGTAAGKRLYVNGTSVGTADGNAPTSFAAGAKSFRFGAWMGGAGWNADADVEIALFTPDCWSEQQARRFTTNPFQVLAPRNVSVFFAPTAAGGSTFFNPMSGRGGAAAQPLVLH